MRLFPVLAALALVALATQPGAATFTGVQQAYEAGGVGLYVTAGSHPGLGTDGLDIIPVRLVSPTPFHEVGILVHDHVSGHAGFGVCVEEPGVTCLPSTCLAETVTCVPLAFDTVTIVFPSELPPGTAVDVFVYAFADDSHYMPTVGTTGVATGIFVV